MDLLERAAASPPAAARADLEAALRAGGEHLWVHRAAARIYATHVGDRAAAMRVLEQAPALTCIEHRLVAAAWSELGEPARAAGCLERAAHNARTARDLCVVALGYRDAGYADEARLIVDGAARVAVHAMDAWTVASCYRDAFGDAARAGAVLADGLRDATGVGELLGYARAFAAHDADAAQLAAIVTRAETLASTVRHWIDLSRAHHLLLLEPAAALACVSRASGLATSPQDERAIAVARGLVQLALLDDERPQLPPSKLLAPGARAFAWERDPNRLLAWLRARITRDRLGTLAQPRRMAFADDAIALLELQKTGTFAHPLPAYLDALRNYAHLDDAELRALACCVLCVDDAAAAVPDGCDAELRALATCCLALGPDAVSAGAALFAALADAYEATQSTTRMGYLMLAAELGLAVCAAWLDPTDPRIPSLLARVLDEAPRWPALDVAPWRPLARRVFVHPRLAPYAQRL